jgi:hypothetical protein
VSETETKKPERLTKRDVGRLFRYVFAKVIDAYNNTRSVLGNPQAIDYAKAIGSGRSAYSSGASGFPLAEFTVDVFNAVKYALTPGEFKFFMDNVADKPLDLTYQSEEYIDMQKKLGKVFISRGLYPVQAYFVTVKK